MSSNFSFNYSNYATLIFALREQEGEPVESLVPRDHLTKLHTIIKQLDSSHDHSAIIEDIAESTFTDLMNYLNHKPADYDKERLKLMIEAAKKLELPETEAKLTRIFAQIQDPEPPSTPPS